MKFKAFILSFFIILIFPLSFGEVVGAKDKFLDEVADVEVNYGVNGYFRADTTLLVTFKFKNIKKDFNGKIELRYFSDNAASCSITKDIVLFKGQNREKYFYPYLNSSMPKFMMFIFDDKGKILWKRESNIDLFETDVNSDIVIAELDEAGDHYHFKGEGTLNVKRRDIKSKDIPSDYMGLKPFDVLIIPNGYLEKENTKEMEVIKARRRTGGLVVEEKDLDKINLYEVLLLKEDRDDWMWIVEKVVGSTLKDLTVRGWIYIIVLGIYIITVSPLAYIILYRKKKVTWYYLAVPVISVVFTIVMYIISSDSRITGLKINYVSVLDLRLNHSYENTIFAVTNSTNRSYGVTVSDGYKVEPAFGVYGISEEAESLEGRIHRKVTEQKKRTDISIGEDTAFETVYFRAEGRPDIHFGNMGKILRTGNELKGEFRNELGIDLEHVFGIFDNEVVYLGNVKKGKIRKINENRNRIFLSDLTGKIGDSKFLKDIFGDDKNYEDISKELLMTMIISKLSVRKYDKPIFLAITKNKLNNEFASKINAGDGYSIFIVSAETYADPRGQKFLNSINRLNYTVHEAEDSFLYNIFHNRTSTIVTYDLPREDFSKLHYFRRYNSIVNPYTILIKNVVTKKFEPIFYPDENYIVELRKFVKVYGSEEEKTMIKDDMSLIGLKRFIDNKKITIRYDIVPTVKDSFSSYHVLQMPKLSLE